MGRRFPGPARTDCSAVPAGAKTAINMHLASLGEVSSSLVRRRGHRAISRAARACCDWAALIRHLGLGLLCGAGARTEA